MKTFLRALLVVFTVAACDSPSAPTSPGPSLALTTPPPSNCGYCAFGPQTFTRSTQPTAQNESVAPFDTDPTFQYFLVVQLTNGAYTETSIKVNGVKYTFDSRVQQELYVPITLNATGNTLSIRVAGPQGTTVNVWIETNGQTV
jgi:hypothetical protein